ncbi:MULTISPECIES: AAA family ATPase [unclassified Streptomyces]|uniref:AAA family ATPase n=1 Tax=unclassified Streptomyces TaxID=2593676 RepID=UPI002DD9C2B5|nr:MULTISPECIES: AAA family ATPase [unclassified Streptomyces]WSA96649.1 AAA family ATPase [Streptomyces sp. NBC_01795]WSB81064.1 AAA family ATPase [Streptomyces sp. NBC_01775]WSS10726.1 AAA family ATPase [Streptomyces sp. NBC_01186]WSS39421.1 AAA family ATPase [Streptomyces sp. NBC_01187]
MTAPSPTHIGVMGAHSTGKTTLLKRIERELRGHGITVARTGKLGRRAASLGLPKMQHHTAASTEWVIAQGIADEIAAATPRSEHAEPLQVVLADRAAWDALAYYRAAQVWRRDRPNQPEHDRLTLLASTQAPKYSLLLATVLDPALSVAGKHDHDGRYRTLVDRHTHRLLAEQDIPHERVTSDPDSQTHAVELALQLCLTEATP